LTWRMSSAHYGWNVNKGGGGGGPALPFTAADPSIQFYASPGFDSSLGQTRIGSTAQHSAPPLLPAEDDEERPLLEELDISLADIVRKLKAVIKWWRPDGTVFLESDLAGPLLLCFILGVCLLLQGKLHFGYLFGFGLIGCSLMFVVLNLMAPDNEYDQDHFNLLSGMPVLGRGMGSVMGMNPNMNMNMPVNSALSGTISWTSGGGSSSSSSSRGGGGISFDRTTSVLGYSLLPLVLLAAVLVFVSLPGVVGFVVAAAVIAWCTLTATVFFETALEMRDQRWLIAYPTALLYVCFALLTFF